MADVITGTPQLDATEMALIAAIVQKELKAKAKLGGTVRDVSMFAKPGALSIAFPKASSFVAGNRAKSAVVDAQALTLANDVIALDQDPTVKYIIDSFSELQSMVDAELESAKRAASANARYVDSAIAAALEAAKGHVVNGVPADVTSADVLNMQEFLLQNNAELENMFTVASVDQRTILMGLPEFTEAQIYGQSPTPIVTGFIGFLYGVPLIISNNLGGSQKMYTYEKDGIALGFQRGFRRDEEKAIDYGTGAKKVVWDAIFGVGGMELGQGTQIDNVTPLAGTESALIASLN